MNEPTGECLICRRACEPDVTGSFSGGGFGVCPSCLADAALGRAVRAMPEGAGLYHMQPEVSGDGWCAKERDFANRGTTPEAALRAAGLMKGEGE